MKTIWEKGEDDGSGGGGCRTMMQETNTRVGGGGGENGSMLEIDGGTEPMRIIQQEECNSSSSSSIGDVNDEDRDGDAKSRYRYDHHNNNGSFDDAIQALEYALLIREPVDVVFSEIEMLGKIGTLNVSKKAKYSASINVIPNVPEGLKSVSA
ncbi:hypothetical protein L6452_33891 [Arctium lappa]|uniref:Uncharacterized protein n=1 Tax=Arctium lappa TaxID=4217 RepID=A0ACB8YGS2_ARCLA|nr:hypothetical protein L6452_33891 [Arctium lappa]